MYIATASGVIGICVLLLSFYYALEMFFNPLTPQDLESGLTTLVAVLIRLVPLALCMTAGGYLLDRGLWALLKLREEIA